jgi:GrpB-like predicted nucleotidyltransferase (UPF0157 family)
LSLDRATIAHLVRRHTLTVRQVLPGAHVELTGSASVGGLDALDVDLVVVHDAPAQVAKELRRRYSPLYPDEWSEEWVAFRDPGPPQVDIVVTAPGSIGDLHHRRAWELIAARQDLQDEYRVLKAYLAHGYDERKRAFFERVVAELRPSSRSQNSVR